MKSGQWFLSFLAVISVLVVLPVWAGQPFPVSDAFALSMIKTFRPYIAHARYDDGSYLKAETAAEKAKPIIPLSDAKRVVQNGAEMGIREFCHEPWEQGFSAFMDAQADCVYGVFTWRHDGHYRRPDEGSWRLYACNAPLYLIRNQPSSEGLAYDKLEITLQKFG
jgi:hypothetical protein